ncbi:hypothetical protein [Desulfosarcina ovata]|uniref:Uncharacterized protein n=1 Tax=Desulfosarcina ovata subsp. ovata TaxID=2752305 RepID=A0A5K8ACE4_9BACT|nr:hypothetical protein [Desulfosarcina ovata]BBO90332.1 hypothetical protein DSCOOX_35120 [Desulfosarcina ovata subsp. ovata]
MTILLLTDPDRNGSNKVVNPPEMQLLSNASDWVRAKRNRCPTQDPVVDVQITVAG